MKKKLFATLILGTMLATIPTAALAETMTINLGSTHATIDGKTHIMEAVAGMDNSGAIMVPVRTIAEAFSGEVSYDAEDNMVRMIFPRGNWATIEINPIDGEGENEDGSIVDKGMLIHDRLYIPADLMAVCLGGTVKLVDYGQDEVYRLIYHVR